MANFPPFKLYIINQIDELIQQFKITGPFLDVGCGKGDVTLHLAKYGWKGDAIDTSSNSTEVSKKLLAEYPNINIYNKGVTELGPRKYQLILILDVLEHVPEDKSFLSAVQELEFIGGYLIITVPSNPKKEWRWDDEFYGHLRRYDPVELKELVESSGFKVLVIKDISFPFFWMLRRGFTRIKQPPEINLTSTLKTQLSPFENAWEMGLISTYLSNPVFWKPFFPIQKLFHKYIHLGNELMILAQKVNSVGFNSLELL